MSPPWKFLWKLLSIRRRESIVITHELISIMWPGRVEHLSVISVSQIRNHTPTGWSKAEWLSIYQTGISVMITDAVLFEKCLLFYCSLHDEYVEDVNDWLRDLFIFFKWEFFSWLLSCSACTLFCILKAHSSDRQMTDDYRWIFCFFLTLGQYSRLHGPRDVRVLMRAEALDLNLIASVLKL